MLLVWDKQPSGDAIPTVTEILGHTTQDGSETSGAYDAIRYDSMDRFQIIKDKIYVINPQAGVINSTGDPISFQFAVPIDLYKKLNKDTNYSGESTPQTIADINSGALYLFFVSDSNDSGQNYSFTGVARLRYID